MQKGRASGEEARPFCIDLVLQGKTLCCWGMQQLANVCYERRAEVGILAYPKVGKLVTTVISAISITGIV